MFKYENWKAAAPLKLKKKLKSEITAVNKNCPDTKNLKDFDGIHNALASMNDLLMAVTDVKGKVDASNSVATKMLEGYLATMKIYLKDLEKRRSELESEGDKIFKEIKLNLKACEAQYIEARSVAKLAMQDAQEDEDEKKAVNYLKAQLEPRLKKMSKFGGDALVLWKQQGDLLSKAQGNKSEQWLVAGGEYSQMATAVADVLKKVGSGAMLIKRESDLKKTFSYKVGSIK